MANQILTLCLLPTMLFIQMVLANQDNDKSADDLALIEAKKALDSRYSYHVYNNKLIFESFASDIKQLTNNQKDSDCLRTGIQRVYLEHSRIKDRIIFCKNDQFKIFKSDPHSPRWKSEKHSVIEILQAEMDACCLEHHEKLNDLVVHEIIEVKKCIGLKQT